MVQGMRRILQAAFAVAAAAAATAQGALWVSPSGNDGNPGTEEQPLRSLERARDLVRARSASMTDDLTVFVEGTLRLDHPLELGPEDSASNGFNIIYTSAPGAHPALSGGFPVTGWAPVGRSGTLWSAPAPAGLADTRTLFVNGAPAQRTRARLLSVFSHAAAGAAQAPPAQGLWRNPADVEFLPEGPGELWTEPSKAPAFVENAFELLGKPGEWYFDRAARRIYYTPRPGEDMASSDVEAASLAALLVVRGTEEHPLSGLIFKGLRFEYADRPTGGSLSAAAVSCSHASALQFVEDEFLFMGAAGLRLGPAVTDCVVEGCLVAQTSGAGLSIEACSGVHVENCRFAYTATGERAGAALRLRGPGAVTVEHCQVDPRPAEGLSNDPDLPASLSGGLGPGEGLTPDFAALAAAPVGERTTPSPPREVSALAEDEVAYVTWEPNAQDGGSPVTGYTVSASSGARVTVSAADFAARGYVRVGGLENDRAVTLTVAATNAQGTGAASAETAPLTPTHRRRVKPPRAPKTVVVSTAPGGTRVSITPPTSNGGSLVVAYEVSTQPGGGLVRLEGPDVLRADATHPLVRVIPGLEARPGSSVSVSAVNAEGAGGATVVRLKP